jgi:hypothetical protein
MKKYSKNITINVSEIQFETLTKLRNRNIKVGDFIRKAISEKIQRDAKELIVKPKKEFCPF